MVVANANPETQRRVPRLVAGRGSDAVQDAIDAALPAPAPSPEELVNTLESVAAADGAPPDTYTTSNGLTFKLRKVSSLLIMEAGRKIKDIDVPVTYIEDKGREEENPNDPKYKAAQAEVDQARTIIVINATLAFGTAVVDALPTGVDHWQTDEWLADVEDLTGVQVPRTGKGRYVSWLKFYAIPDNQELFDLQLAVARLSGRVPEADVAQAEDSFRDNAQGDTAT